MGGVASLRHSHGMRFGVGDVYVVVMLRAKKDDIVLDEKELLAAEWMSWEKIESLVAAQGAPLEGKVSSNNVKIIRSALFGTLITGTILPNSRKPELPSMLYTAPSSSGSNL